MNVAEKKTHAPWSEDCPGLFHWKNPLIQFSEVVIYIYQNCLFFKKLFITKEVWENEKLLTNNNCYFVHRIHFGGQKLSEENPAWQDSRLTGKLEHAQET